MRKLSSITIRRLFITPLVLQMSDIVAGIK